VAAASDVGSSATAASEPGRWRTGPVSVGTRLDRPALLRARQSCVSRWPTGDIERLEFVGQRI
jgi:hypothetical protein